MDFTRRQFLLAPAAAIAGCGTVRTLRAPTRWEGSATVGMAVVPATVDAALAKPGPARARLDAMLPHFRAAAAAVGAPSLLGPRRGERRVVLIKPAVNSNDAYPANASPESVAAAVTLCRSYDPDARIVVSDSSGAVSSGDALLNMRKNGIHEAVVAAGAGAPGFDLCAFERDGWTGIRAPGADHWRRGFGIARLFDRVTDIVLVSRVSAHQFAGHSIAIKNFVGCVEPIDRFKFHWAAGFAPKMEEMIAELCLPFADRLRLVLVDARLAQADFGPYFGKIVRPGIVYATRDVVSADVFGLALLKVASRQTSVLRRSDRLSMRGPWATDQVRHAVEIGLGPNGPASLVVDGDERLPRATRDALALALADQRVRTPPLFERSDW